MKGKLYAVTAVFAAALIALSGCGTTSSATQKPGSSAGKPSESTQKPSTPSGESAPYTITLEYAGSGSFDATLLTAVWSGEGGVYSAAFNGDGVASYSGLDGDYTVTVNGFSDLEGNFAYDTTGYTATSYVRDVSVAVYDVTVLTKGTDWFSNSVNNITKTGVYKVTVPSANYEVRLMFKPPQSGTYVIASWCDTVENNVNPTLYAYNGSSQTPYGIYDEGGSSGTYTKNFEFRAYWDKSNVGGVKPFSISATSKSGEYPVEVIFAITRESDYSYNTTETVIVRPAWDFTTPHPQYNAAGTLTLVTEKVGTKQAFNDDHCRLFEDGFWYVDVNGVYDASNDGSYQSAACDWKPLFAYIGAAGEVYGTALYQVEAAGNNALTITDSAANVRYCYKYFIRGTAASQLTGSMVEYPLCPSDWLAQGGEGYYDYRNMDGMVPVTDELKEFLQAFSVAQALFYDGLGWIDSQKRYDAYEDSQWLFACAYYA